MMNKVKPEETQIYVHIPFCVRKCAYCDFLSFPADEAARQQYVNALLHEIAASSQEWKDRTIRSVFIGGGTPTVLFASQITSILEMLYRCFSVRRDAEITVECNPGTADGLKLKALRESGVNRLSIGAQSFDDGLLRTIGRIHDSSEILSCYQAARTAGFENVNLDLISALPGQTLSGWTDSLRQAAELCPEHISAYSLILEESTPLYESRDRYTFPDEDEERAMYYETAEILASCGYAQYEISNYSKPGMECLHNTGYWTGVEYKGFGLGASSFVNGTRFKNTDRMEEYLECCETPKDQYKEQQSLTEEELRSEFMILGLRMTKGVEEVEFQKHFGARIDDIWPGVTDRFVSLGLMDRENDRVSLTREGISVSNKILCEFI